MDTSEKIEANPLLGLDAEGAVDAIAFDRIDASHVAPAVEQLLAHARAAVEAIAANVGEPPTYDSTLGALERATLALERASLVCEHLESAATTPPFRATWNETQPKLAEFWSSVPLHAGLFKAISAFAASDEAAALDPIRARHLAKTLEEFEKHGAKLDDIGKKKLMEIDVELSKLTTKFSQNVLDSSNAFELIVEDEARIAGLPELAKQAAAQGAAEKGKQGWRFTLHAPSFIPAVTHLDDRDLREQLYRAYNERASSGDLDNRPIIRRILQLRRAKASLLGFADFADFVTSDRMAKSGQRALDFIHNLRERTQAAFDREKAALTDYAGRALSAWDVAYYAEKRRKQLFDFDEEALRPYFPLESVLGGVFEIFKRLYGVEFVARDLPRWHESVRPYHLVDVESGARMATVYLDLFPRDNKVQGAWMGPIATATPPGAHVAVVAANFTPPLKDPTTGAETPALLSHREVETLFHELGHLMHQCLSRVTVRRLGGTNVAWDFVELPSQIMENWTWEREAVDLFARHYQTGATLPQELFDKITAARTYRAASVQMQQLGYAGVDLDLHVLLDPTSEDLDHDPLERARRVLQPHVTAELPSTFAMLASFGHLFASPTGYAAGYYSYKWAEVLDADAFGRFREEGLFNPVVGTAFRDHILARGDSEDPGVLYEKFRGRPPSLDALLERLGLSS